MTSQQRLLSDISHELRTPLTRLQLGTALLRRRSGESKELERIETEAQRLDSMINDLLVMSRNQQKTRWLAKPSKPTSCGVKCWITRRSKPSRWASR